MMVAAAAGILICFLAAGLLGARRRDTTVAGFVLAGRGLPPLLGALAMTAAWVDGGYLLGTAEGAFHQSVWHGAQGGLLFGGSLVLGGLFFAKPMRRAGYSTMAGPFEARYGARWAAVLLIPALAAELIWCAELLASAGSTLGVMGGVSFTAAVVGAALAVTAYTIAGGMWSVVYGDIAQIGVAAAGLILAVAWILPAAGGWDPVWAAYRPTADWSFAARLRSADTSVMLLLGGIPWNCYFQRVLSSRNENEARSMSLWSGAAVMLFTIPPLLLGVAAFSHPWSAEAAARLRERPSEALPALLNAALPVWAALLGLAAILGAVTSSYASSLLSAASLYGCNVRARFTGKPLGVGAIRGAAVAMGLLAVAGALRVRSVQALWFFTSDLVFVLLFPQLVYALFDRRANRAGSMAALGVSLAARLAAGEPLIGLPAIVALPDWFPHRTAAAALGLVVLPVVSRLWERRL